MELAGERIDDRLRGRQGRQLFAYLVVNRNRALSRYELIDAVWPLEPPPRAGPALSTQLSHLRGAGTRGRAGPLGDRARPAGRCLGGRGGRL